MPFSTSPALANSAFGWNSLLFDTTGNFNTGAGAATLALNNADINTAVGAAALILNVNGTRNTAVGGERWSITPAMRYNGFFNDAVGAFALNGNVTGFSNNAIGNSALFFNINWRCEYRHWLFRALD